MPIEVYADGRTRHFRFCSLWWLELRNRKTHATWLPEVKSWWPSSLTSFASRLNCWFRFSRKPRHYGGPQVTTFTQFAPHFFWKKVSCELGEGCHLGTTSVALQFCKKSSAMRSADYSDCCRFHFVVKCVNMIDLKDRCTYTTKQTLTLSLWGV